MAVVAPVKLEDFLEWIKKPAGQADEDVATTTLGAATLAAEKVIGGTPIMVRSFEARVRSDGGLLGLPKTPVVSVDEVVEVYPSGVTYHAAADFLVDDPAEGLVGLVTGASLPASFGARTQRYAVTYTAGLFETVEDVPEDIRLAVCIIGQHLWKQRYGNSARPGLASGDQDDNGVPTGFAIPARARQLLEGYGPGATVA